MSKWADLKVRTISAVVMVSGLAAITIYYPRGLNAVFMAAYFILLFEWWQLVRMRNYRIMWAIAGLIYISLGVAALSSMFVDSLIQLIAIVAAIDIGGYVFGKLFGRHKLAPSISPGKSWEGFVGSILCASLVICLNAHHYQAKYEHHKILFPYFSRRNTALDIALVAGPLLTVVALLGDLFESYLKRKAGVKDSGKLIPGHGGLFDRVDGLLPCAIAVGLPSIFICLMFCKYTPLRFF